MARRKAPIIPDAIVDQLLAGADPKTIFDPNGLIDDLTPSSMQPATHGESSSPSRTPSHQSACESRLTSVRENDRWCQRRSESRP